MDTGFHPFGGAYVKKPRVLFLCTHNSARSQMAKAFLQFHGGDRFEAHSAGLEPSRIHPVTLEVMGEKGFDLEATGYRSKGVWEEYIREHVLIGFLITVCRKAEDRCPVYPGAHLRESWEIRDPAAFRGTREQVLGEFREVRDLLEERVLRFLRDHGGNTTR